MERLSRNVPCKITYARIVDAGEYKGNGQQKAAWLT